MAMSTPTTARLARAREQLFCPRRHAGYTEEYRVTQPPRPADLVLQSRTAWLRKAPFRAGPAGELLRVTHIARDVTWQLDTTARLRAEISRRTDAERNLSEANTGCRR